MGTYLNPGNSGFERMIRDGQYVDKTDMIGIVNRSLNTDHNLISISRPRRFGKSYATQMLCACYDKSCDSGKLFARYKIARGASFSEHLNKYDVIYVDMTGIKLYCNDYGSIAVYLSEKLTKELHRAYPAIDENSGLIDSLLETVEISGNRIVMIIDEWDAPLRGQPGSEKKIS